MLVRDGVKDEAMASSSPTHAGSRPKDLVCSLLPFTLFFSVFTCWLLLVLGSEYPTEAQCGTRHAAEAGPSMPQERDSLAGERSPPSTSFHDAPAWGQGSPSRACLLSMPWTTPEVQSKCPHGRRGGWGRGGVVSWRMLWNKREGSGEELDALHSTGICLAPLGRPGLLRLLTS